MFKKRTILGTGMEDILIKGCVEWDRASQNKLYALYASKMFAVCFKYSSSKEDAEDTFHEGFMKVFEHIKDFKKEGLLEGWIRRIMVNTAIEKYRKQLRMIAVISINEAHTDFGNHFVDDILSKIAADDLMHLIQKLPPQYKMVFNLYEFEGLKHKEIAALLDITEGSSKSNLSRARASLQESVRITLGSLYENIAK